MAKQEIKPGRNKRMDNFICFPARAQAFNWLSFTGLQSKRRDKQTAQSPALYKPRQWMKANFFIQAQWKSLLKQQFMKSDQKCDCNVSKACLCLDRSAISSHSALRSSTDHHRKRLRWMCSLRTCQCALRQRLPEAGFVGLWRHFAVLQWRYGLVWLRTERMNLAHDSG